MDFTLREATNVIHKQILSLTEAQTLVTQQDSLGFRDEGELIF